MLLERESNEQGFSEVRLVGGSKIMKNLELSFGRITKKLKMKNHSPLEGESNEQGFSEVRLVGGSKIIKNLELRII